MSKKLISLLVLSLFLLATGVVVPMIGGDRVPALSTAFWAHLIFALGVMSMITAAMQHFAPVLARSRGPGRVVSSLPGPMLLAGGMAVSVFAGLVLWHGIASAALLGLLSVAVMLGWMWRLQRHALGGAHPGLAWYLAAMACLGLGLAAASLMPFLPVHYGALRAFHWNINLFGFVGLTAIGTVQVLMPTVASRPDPEAGSRLRQDLIWALGGALLLALGQALQGYVLAGLGALVWAAPLLRMGLAWLRLYREEMFALHGGEPLLSVAMLGLVAALGAAVARGVDVWASSHEVVMIFVPGFLFPLFSAAAGQLAPVWRRPGPATNWHADSRQCLLRYGGVRAVLFAVSLVLLLLDTRYAAAPALIGLLWFGVVFAGWLRRA